MLAQITGTLDALPAVAVPAGGLWPRDKSDGLRALVVDDEPLVRWAVAETLRLHGYEVAEAGDAQRTVQALRNAAAVPDVVLLDLRLPDCSDLTLLQTVGLLAPAATVILMTAHATPDLRERARQFGAACVLDKPFDIDGLEDTIAVLRTQR
jgi:DNA-binding NtrC family response regulator